MAPKMALGSCFMSFAVVLLALPLCFHTSFGEEEGVTCERMSADTCAFTVSWSGKRCVLERSMKMRSGIESYVCRTSAIEAAGKVKKNTIESDHCVQACGIDRKTLGISSDSLFDRRFTGKLCSPKCYLQCPNVVDLYFNVAAGEGVFLPRLCAAQKKSLRRSMSEHISYPVVEVPLPPPIQHVHRFLLGLAPGPVSAVEATDSQERSLFALAPESVETADLKERSLFGLAPEPTEAIETADFAKRSLSELAPGPAEAIETADFAERSLSELAPEAAETFETADFAERSLSELAPEAAETVETADYVERSLFGLAPEAAETVETGDFS